MILVVREIQETDHVDQSFTIGDEDLFVKAIRPHLYLHNSVTASLKIQLLNSSEKLISESETITTAAIRQAFVDRGEPDDFIHGYVRFYLTTPLRAGSNIIVRLKASGYTFSESAYVGWCNDYDLRKVTPLYTPNDGWRAALDTEFWVRRRVNRGQQ